jgi:hypothetical protein
VDGLVSAHNPTKSAPKKHFCAFHIAFSVKQLAFIKPACRNARIPIAKTLVLAVLFFKWLSLFS